MRDKSLFGVILVLLGIGFLLDQFHIISFNNIISIYWPIILIVIGVLGLINKKSSKIGNSLLIVFGIFFQARNLDLIDVNIFRLFWPVILIIIGIRFIFEKNILPVKKDSDDKRNNRNTSSEDYIDEFAIMSGIETNIESQEFKGGKTTAIMAGIELDLRGASLYNNEATINVNVIMGGVEIYVPEHWRVEHRGTPILGGFTNKRKNNAGENSPVLIVDFSIIMGGIDIK